jgi:hypothetical protein
MAELTPYKTSDTPLAAFLHYCGYKIVGSVQDPNDHKREVLLFVQDDDIDDLEKLWRSGKANGQFREYHRSLKIVTRYVNEARKSRD